MSLEVEFEEQDFMKKNTTKQPKGISAYLIKNGWAHDQASVNKLLMFLTVLFLLSSLIIYYLFVVRSATNVQVKLPDTIIKKLSPEMQVKIRASQQ